LGDHRDGCRRALHGRCRRRVDDVAVAPAAERIGVDLVSGSGDGAAGKSEDFGGPGATGPGVLDGNLPLPPLRVPAVGRYLAAEIDYEVLHAALLQHAHHLVEGVPLGNAAEVDCKSGMALAQSVLRNLECRACRRTLARYRAEPPAADERPDGRIAGAGG